MKDESITIGNVRHTSYLEHYTFSRGTETAIFKIHYNGQNKITTIEKPSYTNEFIENIYSKLSQLQNKTIIITEKEPQNSEAEFEFEQQFLKQHYEKRKGQMSERDICIVKIEHFNYQEVYTFKRSGFEAVYRFYYNGKKQFTRYDVDGSRSTGLIAEINEILKK